VVLVLDGSGSIGRWTFREHVLGFARRLGHQLTQVQKNLEKFKIKEDQINIHKNKLKKN
jgi:hypothetical protein